MFESSLGWQEGDLTVGIRKSRLLWASVLTVICCLMLPVSSSSQCNVTSSTASTITTAGTPYYIYVIETISNASTCTLTMFMNVFACHPGGQPPVTGVMGGNTLTASAYTTATNPSCGWVCDCGPVAIDSNDGLPVELMDFGIAELETDERAEEPDGETRDDTAVETAP